VTAVSTRPAATAAGQALLPPVRAAYGVMLVAVPGVVIHLATGRPPGRRECRIARLLGARHLVQAAVSVFAPIPDVLAAGAGVDALHTASMLTLAVADRRARRLALIDALAESLFAAAGFSSAGLLG
jgi:hypothetical protein